MCKRCKMTAWWGRLSTCAGTLLIKSHSEEAVLPAAPSWKQNASLFFGEAQIFIALLSIRLLKCEYKYFGFKCPLKLIHVSRHINVINGFITLHYIWSAFLKIRSLSLVLWTFRTICRSIISSVADVSTLQTKQAARWVLFLFLIKIN